MAYVDIYIWNVDRGDAILIKGPEKNAIIDLGDRRAGFSPAEHIYYNHNVHSIDYLVITHPDNDHINDVPKFTDLFSPTVIASREEALPYVKRRKNTLYPNDEQYQAVARAYIKLVESYNRTPKYTPRDPEWNEGLTLYHTLLPKSATDIKPVCELRTDEKVNLNNLSIVTILRYGGFQLVTAGDLEADAIERLLRDEDTAEQFRGTNILIAPHHGRESSYTPELFKYMSPDIVAISDAKAGTTNASSKYSYQANGCRVQRRNGPPTERNVVTTRDDGVIYIGVNTQGYNVRID